MIVRARAPLRLGFGGGGTDVSPYCDEYGGLVLNATIERYAYTTIKPLREKLIRFVAVDRSRVLEMPLSDPLSIDGNLDLHKSVYRHFFDKSGRKRIGVELTTLSDAPMGSGLGASSTLVVSMVKAFSRFLGVSMDLYDIANLAFHLERVDCKLEGGRQDQFSATFGGFNLMEFGSGERTLVMPLRIQAEVINELEASLILYFTGISRESANIICRQQHNLVNGSKNVLSSMHRIKEEARIMKETLLTGNLHAFAESMRVGWENKKATAEGVSSQKIDRIYEAAMSSGALGGKVSGAGGGGFLLLYVPPECRMKVNDALSQFGGVIEKCHFTDLGCQAWDWKS